MSRMTENLKESTQESQKEIGKDRSLFFQKRNLKEENNVRFKDGRLVSFLFLFCYLSFSYFLILILLYYILISDLGKGNDVILYMTITTVIINIIRHDGYYKSVTYVTATVTISCDTQKNSIIYYILYNMMILIYITYNIQNRLDIKCVLLQTQDLRVGQVNKPCIGLT